MVCPRLPKREKKKLKRAVRRLNDGIATEQQHHNALKRSWDQDLRLLCTSPETSFLSYTLGSPLDFGGAKMGWVVRATLELLPVLHPGIPLGYPLSRDETQRDSLGIPRGDLLCAPPGRIPWGDPLGGSLGHSLRRSPGASPGEIPWRDPPDPIMGSPGGSPWGSSPRDPRGGPRQLNDYTSQ